MATVAVPARRVRAGTAVAVTVALGLSGHAVAGETVPALAIPLAALLVLVPAWLLTRRERRWPVIATLLLGGQFLVHLTAATTAALFAVPHEAHGAGEPIAPLPTGSMLIAHAAAAGLVGAWLRLGERWLWRAARRAAGLVAAAFRRLLGCPRRIRSGPVATVRATPGDPAGPLRWLLLRYALVLRGPPVLG
jgi:hypothetical protein